MDKTQRRKLLFELIKQSKSPISASALSKTLGVSRQVVVGDVALLRAEGSEIIATAQGYMLSGFVTPNQFKGRLACRHSASDAKTELYIIVDSGAIVVDVVVEHEIYGEISGQLNLRDRNDVDVFIAKVESSKIGLLSELTAGMHLHTVACRDMAHYDDLRRALDSAGFLMSE